MTTNAAALIEARALAIGYGRMMICTDIDFQFGSGEIVCLLGPNGSGKTTLFKSLLGLIDRQDGTLSIAGRPIETMSRQDIARQVAYVPQTQTSAFPYSVIDMVLMGRTAHVGLFAAPGRRDREAAREALHLLGILDLEDREFTRISGGQRQLVMIARALAQQTPAIIMDEPTSSLDFGNQARVLTQIAQLAQRGLGIVISTHDPDHAFAIGTRVALLHQGGVVAAGVPKDVLTSSLLKQVYGVDVAVETLSNGRLTCVPTLGL